MTQKVGADWKQLVVVLLAVAGSCIGAPADGLSVFADNSLCPEPRCVTYEEINTLWAIPDPDYFLQCRPNVIGSWSLEQMPCAPATLFSFRHQVCVHIEYWEGCDGSTPSTLPTTAETTPEPETTETPEVTPETPEVTTEETPEVTTEETPEVTTEETPEVTTEETPEVTTEETPEVTPDVTTDFPPDLDPCGEPLCDTYEHINTLWTHASYDYFYQCRPIDGIWAPIAMPCAPATLFSFRQQVCVLPEYWDQPNCAV